MQADQDVHGAAMVDAQRHAELEEMVVGMKQAEQDYLVRIKELEIAVASPQDVPMADAIAELEEIAMKYAQSNAEYEAEVAAMKEVEQDRLAEITSLQQAVAGQSAQMQHAFELEAVIGMMKQTEELHLARIAELEGEATMHNAQLEELQEVAAVRADRNSELENVINDTKQVWQDQLAKLLERNADLEQEVQAHAQRAIQLEGQLKGMERQGQDSAAQGAHLQELAGRVERQEETIRELRLVEQNLKSQVADLGGALAESNGKAAAHCKELEETIMVHTKRSSRLEAVVDAMQKTEQDYETRVSQLQDRLHRAEAEGGACRRRAAELEEQLRQAQGEHDAQLAQRDAQIAQLRQAANTGESAAACAGGASAMAQAARIAELEANGEELKGVIKGMEEREGRIAQLEAMATQMRAVNESVSTTSNVPRIDLSSTLRAEGKTEGKGDPIVNLSASQWLVGRQDNSSIFVGSVLHRVPADADQSTRAVTPRTTRGYEGSATRLSPTTRPSPQKYQSKYSSTTPAWTQQASALGFPSALGGSLEATAPALAHGLCGSLEASAGPQYGIPMENVRAHKVASEVHYEPPRKSNARCSSPIRRLQSQNGPQKCVASPVRMPQSVFGSQCSTSLLKSTSPDAAQAGCASPPRTHFRSPFLN